LGANGVEVRPALDEGEVEAAQELRLRVFSGEQGISRDGEIDGLDPASTHIVAVRRGSIVGTCRLRFGEGRCKLERMVVDQSLRRTGVGRDLIEGAEREAQRQGAGEMVLHAQRQVEAFYTECGYAASGETFLEEGIPHVQMGKALALGDRRSGRDRRAS
jgi:predicted GNAT family N-acyltransferase